MNQKQLQISALLGVLFLSGLSGAYSLTLDLTSEAMITTPVTAKITLDYNTTNNETAVHECAVIVYQHGYEDNPIRVYNYNPIVPALSTLKTDESGRAYFQFVTNNHDYVVYDWFGVTAYCAGVEDTQTVYLTPKKEGIWFINTALNMHNNPGEIVGIIFVLFGLVALFAIILTPLMAFLR